MAFLTTAQLTSVIPQRLRFPVLFILPAVIGSVLILGVKQVRTIASLITIDSLVKWQICRVIGAFFLVGALFGKIDTPFAIVSGLGDVAVGISAWFAWRRIKQHPDNALKIAKTHALFGLADFTLAATVALSTQARIEFLYGLIPLFLVPMAILGHVATLARKE